MGGFPMCLRSVDDADVARDDSAPERSCECRRCWGALSMGCGAPGPERWPTSKGAPGSTSSLTPGGTRYSSATTSSRHGA
eukprot:5475047-Pyramimonas_sp.AAC.1